MLPIRWRLTLFHALAILGIATLLSGLLVAALIRGVVKEVEETARARAVEAVRVLETTGLPDDAEFRAALRAYMVWAVDDMLSHPDGDAAIKADAPMPRWTWDGLVIPR